MSRMYILACGDAQEPLINFTWIKEFTHITEFEYLKSKAKKNKKYEDKVFIFFELDEYANNRKI